MNQREISSLSNLKKKYGEKYIKQFIEEMDLTYETFVKNLYTDLRESIKTLQSGANKWHELDEDSLTLMIVYMLNCKGYEAEHSIHIRGKVDLTVKKCAYQWIGEAKIYNQTKNLEDGFNQLHTRYNPGDILNTGIIIYYKRPNVKKHLKDWEKKLKTYSCFKKIVDRNNLEFTSVHQHTGSGSDINITHFPVLLHYNPKK